MPPRRPLPDLVLIAVFKQLTPNSQLTASRMSNRCYLLVRAANRRMKLLIISDSPHALDINPFNFLHKFSEPRSKQFGVFFGLPVTPFSQWNLLKLSATKKFDQSTVERIVTIFSAVTSFTFATIFADHNEELIALLQQPQWATQLTSCVLFPAARFNKVHRLTSAINALPALQHLAYDWWTREMPDGEPVKLPELTILSQLKTIAVHCMPNSVFSAFERSIDRHAADNADLQVYLLSWRKQRIFGDLQTLSDSFRSRIVCFRELICLFADVPPLCNQFPRLISLSIYLFNPDQVRPAFSALSRFRQLAHLNLDVKFNTSGEEDEEQEALPARPVDQLHSVRVLTLSAPSSSHGQLRWLNLQWTLPHLQTLVVQHFFCKSCQIGLNDGFRQDAPADEFSQALSCIRESFLKVHSGVLPRRIFIETDWNKYRSAEELLATADGQ